MHSVSDAGAKLPAAGQFRLQLAVIVNFAVVGDDRAVRPVHRLCGRGAEIDDGKPSMRQPYALVRRQPNAFTVRPAMRD